MSFRVDRFVDDVDPIVKLPKLEGLLSNHPYEIMTKATSLDLGAILNLLSRELAANQLYSAAWSVAEQKFEQKKQYLLGQAVQPIPTQCHVAIIAYTMDAVQVRGQSRKLFREFNNACHKLLQFPPHRCESPCALADETWSNFPYKSLFCLLMHALPGVRSQPDPKSAVTYRGVSMHYNVEDIHDESWISFEQFTSTSANKAQARGFIRGPGTLFCFNVNSMAAMGISQYSDFLSEEEILIFPWSSFVVDHIDQTGEVHMINMHGEGPFIPELPYSLCSPIDEYQLQGYQPREKRKCIGCLSDKCNRKNNPPRMKFWPFS